MTTWNPFTKKWYESKGYIFAKWKDEFEVKVEDLQDGCSSIKVNVKCDNCGEILKNIKWQDYKRYVHKDGKYYCRKCALKLYGTENMEKTQLKNSKSFEQWCIDNNRQNILDRWDYKLNEYSPKDVSFSSNKKFYFKCSRGLHNSELKRIGSLIIGEGNVNCNQCNSFAQWGIDNICSDFLEKYWDYEKNIGINPWETSYGEHKKVWIKCQEKDYHESYDIKCYEFVVGNRCPYCSGNKIHLLDSFAQYLINNYGENALELYWDYEKNKNLDPCK